MKSIVDELRDLTRGWKKDSCPSSQMSPDQISTAERLCAEDLLGNYGRAVHPGGIYYINLAGEIALGRPPKWWTDMSPREKATHAKPHERTEEDYLVILSERPDARFGEYDNVPMLIDMTKRGLITPKPDNIISSMCTSLRFFLTEEGRSVLAKESGETRE